MAAILDALALAVCVAVIPLGTVVVEVEPLVGWVVVVRMEPREGERVAAMNQVIDAKSPVVDAALGERGIAIVPAGVRQWLRLRARQRADGTRLLCRSDLRVTLDRL